MTTITGYTKAGADSQFVAHTEMDYGYLVANFGNNVTPYFEKLNIHFSADGKYVAAGANNPVYTPASTNSSGGLRDPSIKKINGKWYCVHGINNGANFTFECAVSDDLVNWTLHSTFTTNTTQIPNLLYVWAPELIYDPVNSVYVVLFTAVLSTSGNPHDIYWTQAADSSLSSWSAPTKIAWSGASNGGAPIDPTAVYVDNQWFIFYGNNGSIQRATCATLTGTWNTDQTGNWAGWYTDTPANSTIHYEGIELVQVDATTWRIYGDQYTGSTAPYTTVGYWWSETTVTGNAATDFLTWTPMTECVRSPGYPDGYALRHGTWLHLTSQADKDAVLAATSAGGPREIWHVEYTGTGASAANTTWAGSLVKDTNKSSARADDMCSVSGTTVTILQNGLYAVHFCAPDNGNIALGGGWMAIKDPSGTPIYTSHDIVSSAAAWSQDATGLWLTEGTQLDFEFNPADAMPSNFVMRVWVTRLA